MRHPPGYGLEGGRASDSTGGGADADGGSLGPSVAVRKKRESFAKAKAPPPPRRQQRAAKKTAAEIEADLAAMRADAVVHELSRVDRVRSGLKSEAEEANQEGKDNVAPTFLEGVSSATLDDGATLESRVRTKRHTHQKGDALESGEAFMGRAS